MGWYANQMARHEAALAARAAGAEKRGGTAVQQFAGISLVAGSVGYEGVSHPVAGAVAAVDSVGDKHVRDRTRLSVTRMVALGMFSLAAPKRKQVVNDTRELYLTVTGAGYQFVVPVPPDKGLEARQFAAAINTASSGR